MRRTLGSVGAWLVATSIAIFVAWFGVRSVQFAAVPDRIEPLSASDARKLAPRSPSPSPDESPVPDESPSPSTAPPPSPTSNPASPGEHGWQKVPDGKGGFALQRTFQVTGGAATIRFAEGDVRVTATEPAA